MPGQRRGKWESKREGAREGRLRQARRLRGYLAVAAVALSAWVLVSGCSRLGRLREYGSEGRIYRQIAERAAGAGRVEGVGKVTIEHRDERLELPFAVKIGAHGSLEIEADVSPGFWHGFGRIAIVSNQKDTAVYSLGRRVDAAAYDSLDSVLRPVLLSIFGGSDMLLHWETLNGCRPGRRSVCKGLEIGVILDRRSGAVERWTIRDPARGVTFNGFVEAGTGEPGGPRITGGMLHPYEVGITVEYTRVGMLAGTDGAARGATAGEGAGE